MPQPMTEPMIDKGVIDPIKPEADGTLDYNCNGVAGDEGAADALTPMQPYVERAFDYLTAWAERGQAAPGSKLIPPIPSTTSWTRTRSSSDPARLCPGPVRTGRPCGSVYGSSATLSRIVSICAARHGA